MRRPAAIALLLVAALGTAPARAVETRFWEVAGPREVPLGELQGVSLTAAGEVLLAPDLEPVPLEAAGAPPPPFAWRAVQDRRGNVYVGSGIRGAVYRVTPKGEVSVFFTVPELEVHGLALDSKDRLLVGSSPAGRVYRVSPDGKGEILFEPQERYIWDLAVGRGDVVFVATGEHGKLFRIDAEGNGAVLFDGDEPHLVSLAVDVDGSVVAGGSGSGLVYRIGADGSGRVLYDAEGEEVAGVGISSTGVVYAAVNALIPPEKKPKDERRPEEAEETLSGEIPSGPPGLSQVEDLTGRGEEIPLKGPLREVLKLRSQLYRIPPVGTPTRVWESADEGIHALLVARDDRIYFGAGVPGRLYLHDGKEDGARLLARFSESQVTALAGAGGAGLTAVTSNQARLYRTSGEHGDSGSYLSAVRDAGGSARWGRVWWQAEAPAGTRVEIATRSGNSARPDATWSEWSPAAARSDGSPIASPPARYLQFRARLSRLGDAPTPRLRAVHLSYREANLPPRVAEVRIAPPEPERNGAKAAAAAPEGTPATLKIAWSASDPNGDDLVYDVSYRAETAAAGDGAAGWQRLVRGLRETSTSWDTTGVPGGRYRVRVQASDAPDNDEETALAREARSEPVVIDREPPRLELVRSSGAGGVLRAGFRAIDAVSPLVRADLIVDDRPAVRLDAADGLDDGPEERYDVNLQGLSPGPHQVKIAVRDREGNRATQTVTVEVSR